MASVLVEKILDNSLRMFVTLAATRKLLADYLSGLSKKFPVRVVHRWPLRPIESAQYAWNIHTTLAIWRDLMHGNNVLCLVLRHLARMEFVEEIQMHPDQDYGVVFRRWGVKYGFSTFSSTSACPRPTAARVASSATVRSSASETAGFRPKPPVARPSGGGETRVATPKNASAKIY